VTVSIARRNRIDVSLEADFGECVDVGIARDAGAWKVRRQFAERSLLTGEPLSDRFLMRCMHATETCIATCRERRVEFIKSRKRWNRAQEVVFDVAMSTLNAAFLVAFGGSSKPNVERSGTSERKKRFVLFVITPAQDTLHALSKIDVRVRPPNAVKHASKPAKSDGWSQRIDARAMKRPL
jgi:hypothetical protein